MHVIFTIRYFHPFIGGTEKQALNLASHLVAKGVGVTILTSRFQRSWKQCEVLEKVKVVRLFSPRVKVWGALVFLSCLAHYLIRHRNQYSIIHTFQISYTSFLSVLLSLCLKKPSLLKLASSGSGGDIQRAKQTPWGRCFLLMAKKASRIISVSARVEHELLAEYVQPSVISHIANGVDLAYYSRHMDKSEMRKKVNMPDKKTIIYTGRLSAEKGVDFLICSFSHMNKHEPCQLVIIGDGPERENILTVINACGVSGSVLIIAKTANVAPYLQSADMFVLPSRFEGLSNSLLEAMACGLPVISTRVGGSTDIIEDGVNGLLIDVDSKEQLAGAMEKVFNDCQLADILGGNARKTMEAKHDISRIAERYITVYQELQ